MTNAHDASDGGSRLLPIGDVVALLRQEFPDLTPSSLRFLEREGLVAPTRSPGGHRLYAPADIERVRRIKAWQAQRLSLADIRTRLGVADRPTNLPALADTFLGLALADDPVAAYQAVLSADESGVPLERLFAEVLQPALTELGRRWEAGEALVAQEKEVSRLARDLVADLSRRHASTHPGAPTLVAACVEGEHHELGLFMVCGLLRARGIAVHFLGADVAPRFVLEAVRLHRPVVVLLSVLLAPNLPAVGRTIDALKIGLDPEPLPPIVVGGQAASENPAAIRAWGGTTAASALPGAPPFDLDGLLAAITGMSGPD